MDSLFKSSVPDASSGRQRDDASDLSGGPGRDPHITGGDALWGDREGGGHQCHESGIVAPYRLRAETEIRQRGRLLDPGRPNASQHARSASARIYCGVSDRIGGSRAVTLCSTRVRT
jgi:hypothetical protein